jgi:hypothetical protein
MTAVRARRRCQTRARTPGREGAPAVCFEVELTVEGVVDRLDDLAQWFEELAAGSFGFAFAGRAQQDDAQFGQGGFEVPAEVVLVGDQGLSGSPAQLGVGGEDRRAGYAARRPWRR